MRELFFELPLRRDVGCDTCNADHLAGRISNRETSVANPRDLPVRATNPIDLGVATLRTQTYGRLDACPVVFVDRVEETVRLAIHALERPAPDLLISGTDVERLALVPADEPEHLFDRRCQLAESLLTRLQCSGGGTQFGDIGHHSDHAQRVAVGVALDIAAIQRDTDTGIT